LVFLFAVLAAVANSVASVCERWAAATTSDENLRGRRLVAALIRQPVWFGGVAGLIAGFLFQLAALAHGRLGVVQPILLLELPITLALAAVVFRRRVTRSAAGAVAAMTAGLAVFLFAADPRGGDEVPGAGSWAAVLALFGGLLGGLTVLALRTHGARRAALLAVTAGGGFGLTAVLMKGATQHLHSGVLGLFTAWSAYAMAAVGCASFYLFQRALQAGPLDVVQPGVTIVDPVVAIVAGTLLFGDQLRTGLAVVPEVIGVLGLVYGTVVLSRSPLLAEVLAPDEQPRPATARSPR
jgi:drug/metabolite transporter (DMT)-like permease